MVYLRYSNSLDSNHYSFPLPVIPTLYADDFKLHDIQYTPIFGGDSTKTFKDLERPFPWEHFKPSEYAHDIREQEQGIPSRTGLKPYQVVQPEGASVSEERRACCCSLS
jgi:primary-amine oxidase